LRQSQPSGSAIRDPRSARTESRIPDSGSRRPDPGSQLRKKLTFNESRELESLPARIEGLEEEQTRLQAEAAAPGFYKESPDHIRAVLARIELIAPELEAALTRWVELEERTKSV
jgi:ATP-binding cassette subfamily F protein uup